MNEQVHPPEIDECLKDTVDEWGPEISEEETQRKAGAAVDTSDTPVERSGPHIVYAYGYSLIVSRLN